MDGARSAARGFVCQEKGVSMGDTVQCYMCTEGEFDPYGEMEDGETVQRYACTDGELTLR